MSQNILHSNNSPEWYTPPDLVEKIRKVLGKIDLDPASCAQANEVVKAGVYYTEELDGLKQVWFGNVFLNPPSRCSTCEKRCTCKLPLKFMTRMFDEFYNCTLDSAVYLGFSLGQLKYLGRQVFAPEDVRICILDKRIQFVPQSGEAKSPTQDNFIMLLTEDLNVRTRFDEIFSEIGTIISPV